MTLYTAYEILCLQKHKQFLVGFVFLTMWPNNIVYVVSRSFANVVLDIKSPLKDIR